MHGRTFETGRPTWAPEGMIAVTTLQPYSTRFREGTNQLMLVSTTGVLYRFGQSWRARRAKERGAGEPDKK